jgi:hypothetical protein
VGYSAQFLHAPPQKLPAVNVVACFLLSLNKEITVSPETSADFQLTAYHCNPEDKTVVVVAVIVAVVVVVVVFPCRE